MQNETKKLKSHFFTWKPGCEQNVDAIWNNIILFFLMALKDIHFNIIWIFAQSP